MFLGTETWGSETLEHLATRCDDLVVYGLPASTPPAFAPPFGTSVATVARRHSLRFVTTDVAGDETVLRSLLAERPSLLISSNWRRKLTAPTLRAATLGAFNVHASLLPAYRGSAPIVAAIANGDSESGLTIHRMVEALDAGPIASQTRFEIGPDDTVEQVLIRALGAMPALLDAFLFDLARERLPTRDQCENAATWTAGLARDFRTIDITWSARRVHDRVRALSFPYPGALLVVDETSTWIAGASRVVEHDVHEFGAGDASEYRGGLLLRCGGCEPAGAWVWLGSLQDERGRPIDVRTIRSVTRIPPPRPPHDDPRP